MESKAKLSHLRISPRKVRLVADMIRGLSVDKALNQLKFSNKKAAHPLTKLINSSVANAEHNQELKKDNLFIKEIRVDDGPSLKRWRPRAFGRAAGIQKRTSHINLVLAEINPTKEKDSKKGKKEDKKLAQAKIVKSLDEIKESPVDERDVKDEKDKPVTEEGKPDIVDTSRMGSDRNKQHLDKVKSKEKSGTLKRMFRRKSV